MLKSYGTRVLTNLLPITLTIRAHEKAEHRMLKPSFHWIRQAFKSAIPVIPWRRYGAKKIVELTGECITPIRSSALQNRHPFVLVKVSGLSKTLGSLALCPLV
jgi:hypothetical protein